MQAGHRLYGNPMNDGTVLYSLATLMALLPSGILCLRQGDRRPTIYWILLGVAVAGPVAWALALVSGGWRVDFSGTLWITIAATMALFFGVAMVLKEAWRLTPLLILYMLLLGFLAMIWQHAPAPKPDAGGPEGWVGLHIAVSVLTYAFATLAALAALAAFLQERALKSKRPTKLTHKLPSVADSDRLLVRLLTLAAMVLTFGVLSGMATLYLETGRIFVFDHKGVLSVTALGLIVALLLAHLRTGLRGRRVARLVLAAYLLLTLGYPGVKFVTDVLMG